MATWEKSTGCGTCPVTGGVPTRMTEACFDALCRAKRTAGKTSEGEDGGAVKSCNMIADAVRKKMNVCSTCRGKKRPAELEIIKMEKMIMATKRGVCDSCGEKGLMVSPNHGVLMCSTCKTIHSHVKNRARTVVGAIKRLDITGHYVGELADNLVQTTVESLAMERIAAAVGYEGKNGDELIAAVEAMAASRWKIIDAQIRDAALLEEISEIMGSGPADPEAGFVELVKDVSDLVEDHLTRLKAESRSPSMDVVRSLGLPEGPTSWQTIELAAMQTAAMLDEAEGERAENQYELLRLRQLVKLPGSPLRKIVDQVEHLIAALDAGGDVDADLVTANNRVEELETTISQIRDAFDQPVALGMDISAEVGRLVACHRSDREYIKNIGDALGVTGMTIADALKHCFDLKALARYAQPVAVELCNSARPAESYILDLALMALRGEVVGLDPDFLVVMREAV